MPLVGVGVSAASRTLGHWISVGTTLLMMGLVSGFVFTKVKGRKGGADKSFKHVYGPFVMVLIASVFIMAEPVRHVLQDVHVWEECGNNDVFPRVNQTWNDGCAWSSSQYKCENLCYVQTWDESCGKDGQGCGGAIDLNDFYDTQEEINDMLAEENPDDQCHCIDDSRESWSNLSPIGILFTITFTYLGFAILCFGVMWNADIVKKLAKVRSQWKALRDPVYAKQLRKEKKQATRLKEEEKKKALLEENLGKTEEGECTT